MGYRWSDVRILSPRPSPHDFHLQTNRMGRLRPVKGRMMDDQTRRVRIVIADDESIIRMDLREMLMHLGYDVIGEAADGRPVIELALARFRDLQRLEQEVEDLKDALETRKLIERAKGILMELHGLSEADAFNRMRRASMDSRKSMREVAEAILLTYQVEAQST